MLNDDNLNGREHYQGRTFFAKDAYNIRQIL